MCRNIDVLGLDLSPASCVPVLPLWNLSRRPCGNGNRRRTPMAARSAGRSVSRLATRKCVSKWTEFENYGGQTVPCYQFQGRQRRDPN
jgi:hypothetical protein